LPKSHDRTGHHDINAPAVGQALILLVQLKRFDTDQELRLASSNSRGDTGGLILKCPLDKPESRCESCSDSLFKRLRAKGNEAVGGLVVDGWRGLLGGAQEFKWRKVRGACLYARSNALVWMTLEGRTMYGASSGSSNA
jgi:hypothetical protein